MPTNTLYIMTGLPYSGKTTMTKKLVERFGWKVVSVDKIMEREKMWRKGHPTQDDWNMAYSEAYKTMKKLLKEGKNVVFDCGNLPFKERQTSRDIAESLEVNSKLIYLKVGREEIMKRRAKNTITKERGHLDDEEMNLALALFEEVRPEEEPLIYDGEMGINRWIDLNIEK